MGVGATSEDAFHDHDVFDHSFMLEHDDDELPSSVSAWRRRSLLRHDTRHSEVNFVQYGTYVFALVEHFR